MVKFGVYAAFAAMVIAVPASAATIITNGGFEQPGGVSVRDYLTTNYLPGWTYSDNGTGADIYEDDGGQDGLTAANGTHYVSFGHSGAYGGSLTQTFTTTAGHSYRLSLATAEQQGDDQAQRFFVQLTTSLGNHYSFYIDNPMSSFATTIQDFFPNGISTTLKITDATPAGSGAGSNLALDAVSVTDITAGVVPEPAIWAMLIGGFGVVGSVLRGRKVLARGFAYA